MARTDFVERSPLTRDALDFASDRHAGQVRDLDGEVPFVTHPVEVACLLHEAGYSDEIVAAGVLHDVLEDTDVQSDELRGRFGDRVAELVASVSDDPSIEDELEQKAALRRQVADAGEHAGAIFAADKVSKARELRQRLDQGTFSEQDRAKLDHYRASLDMLSGVVPGHAFLQRLREELEGTASRLREQGHPELAS
jgi:(p)ppGpp synthase/HD superfamily hydrolase